jgi:DNA-binding MarR family transcriptional regulator
MSKLPATSRARHAAGIEEQVFQALLLAGNHLLQGEIEVLRSADLTFPQYNILRILRGSRPQSLSCGTISGRMLTRDSDLTRLLDKLEERRLVQRERDEVDRRIVTARITDAGLNLLRRLDEPVRRAHRESLKHFTKAELNTLRRLADAVWQPRK